VAGIAVAVTVFLSDLVPLAPAWVHIVNPWRPDRILIEFGPRQLIAVLIIAGLAIINTRGVGKAGRFQSWITTLKVLGLIGLISAVVILGHPHAATTVSHGTNPAPIGPSAYSAAMLAALAAFNGWANVAMVGGEVQDPERNLPWALTLGMLIVIGLYVAVNLAYLYVLPLDDILTANSTAHPAASSVASRAAVAVLGARASFLLPLLFMVSALGTLHCNMLAVPRVFFSMARDGLLPDSLARVSSIARTPSVAITTLACIAALFAVLGSYDRLTNMATFGYILFFALNTIGFLWWRRAGAEAGIRWRGTWIPVVFLAGMLWLIVMLVAGGSVGILAALALMAAGLPVFAYMRYRRVAAVGA